jgi:protocatechuate 3,4-dioxygenase alpha subunit
MSDITPSQTVGPFFAYGLAPNNRCEWRPEQGKDVYDWKDTVGTDLVTPDASGNKIRIEGCVLDGDGLPINDAMIEIWQADSQGRYASPVDTRARPNAKFKGFGRSATDKAGVYAFDTIKPGSVPGPNGAQQAPHIVFCVFSRGMLRQIYTRLYFPDEAANSSDPILSLVPADRRGTLVAHKESRGDQTVYRFDIRVQGENETVFFDI